MILPDTESSSNPVDRVNNAVAIQAAAMGHM